MKHGMLMTLSRTILLAAALGLLPARLPAASDAGLVVETIQVAGKAVGKDTAVAISLIPAGESAVVTRQLRIGDTLPAGSEIIVPARVVLELVSSNHNRVTVHASTRFKVNVVTERGESYTIVSGSLLFKVTQALNFFNCNYETFLALVRGTEFSVDVKPAQTIHFKLIEGLLTVEREVQIRILETNTTARLRIPEQLEPEKKPEVTYRLDLEEYLREFKTLKEAEDYYRRQLEDDEKSGDVARLLGGLNAMGVVLHALGRDAEAVEYLQRGLQRAAGRQDQHTAAVFSNNLGAALQGLGQYDRAIAQYQEALTTRLQFYPDGLHPDIVGGYNNLGSVYVATGQYVAASRQFEHSLKLERRLAGGEANARVAQTYNNLGMSYRLQGDSEKAIRFHQQALAILAQLYPAGLHPNVASTYHRLGAANAAAGHLSEAIGNFDQATALLRKLYPDAPNAEIADNYSNLGAIYAAMQQPQRAVDYHQQALAIRLKLYPTAPHPSVATSHNNLGAALLDLGDFEAALQHHQEALRQRLKIYSSGIHFEVAVSHTNLGLTYAALKDYSSAVHHYEQALNVWAKLLPGAPHPGAAAAYDGLARAMMALDRHRRAIAYYEQSLAIRLKLHPDGMHLSLSRSYHDLSEAWRKAGDARKAEEFERKARDIDAAQAK